MTASNSFCAKVAPILLSVMRIAVGVLFVCHGAQKLLGYPPGGAKVDHLMTLIGLSAILELAGGGLILIGLLTRPVAFILSGEMAVAYFKVHAAGGLWPIQNRGELAVVYCFVFFYLAAAGAGPLSVDALRKKE
ncbi:MAG TPA: DoxX family protein [Verrucomicrobiae bacterium]|jgi:putative oxidoreductase